MISSSLESEQDPDSSPSLPLEELLFEWRELGERFFTGVRLLPAFRLAFAELDEDELACLRRL